MGNFPILSNSFYPRLRAGGDHIRASFPPPKTGFYPRLRAGGDGMITSTMRMNGKSAVPREPTQSEYRLSEARPRKDVNTL